MAKELTIEPSALDIAQALARVLSAKLGVFEAETIVLKREEAALCLGFINGVAERLEAEERAIA